MYGIELKEKRLELILFHGGLELSVAQSWLKALEA